MPLKHRLPVTAEVDENGTEWIRPRMSGWYMNCCDCSLVHRFQFKIVRGKRRQFVLLRAKRAPRYTAQQRRANARTSRRNTQRR